MTSIRLPSVADVAISTVKELLCFTALPYYQVSGNLKSGEGAVAIGDPIAWDAGTGKYIKYNSTKSTVTDEAVGTGDSAKREWPLVHGNIVSVTNVKVNAVAQTLGTDYWIDMKTGILKFHTPPGAVAITATYVWNETADTAAGTCIGFVRIPGDSTSADVPIEVVVGGAVKYSVVSVASEWADTIITDLRARYVVAADALIF